MLTRTLSTIGLATLLAGCASSPPKDSGFGEVQNVTQRQVGMQVRWNQNSEADQSVQDSVRSMLAKPLSAEQAVQIALLNNHTLQSTFEELGIAQADFVQAGLLKNPVFNLSVRFPNRSPRGTYLDFAVAEDFVSLFFIPARQKLAGVQFQLVTARVSQEVFSLASQTQAMFYTYQAAQQQLELRRSIVAMAAANVDINRRLHEAGNIPDLDWILARQQDTRARADLVDSEAEATDAREKLNRLMGLGGDGSASDLSWTTEPQLLELTTVDLADGSTEMSLETAAIIHRADLSAARYAMDVQAKSLGFTSQTRWFNDVTLGAEAEHETEGQWRIGPNLALPIPLFDQGQATVSRAESMLRQSRQQYFAKVVDVRSEVRAAYAKLQSARHRARLYYEELMPLSQQLVEQTQLQYNGMLTGASQLLQARRDEMEDSRAYIDALRDYWIARAMLQQAIGGRLPQATTRPS